MKTNKRNRTNNQQGLAQQWECPITFEAMKDPVITIDGHSYERRSIQQWLSKQNTSPKTGLPLSSKEIIPNIALKNVITRFSRQIKYDRERIQSQNCALLHKLDLNEQILKVTKKQKQRMKIQYEQLTAKYANFIQEEKNFKQTIQKLKKQNQYLKEQNSQLKSESHRIKSQLNKLTKLSQSKSQLTAELEKIKKQTAQLKENNSSLKTKAQQISKLITLNEELTANVSFLRSQNQRLKLNEALLQKLQVQNSRLTKQNEKLIKESKQNIDKMTKKKQSQIKLRQESYCNDFDVLLLRGTQFQIENSILKDRIQKLNLQLVTQKYLHQLLKKKHSECIQFQVALQHSNHQMLNEEHIPQSKKLQNSEKTEQNKQQKQSQAQNEIVQAKNDPLKNYFANCQIKQIEANVKLGRLSERQIQLKQLDSMKNKQKFQSVVHVDLQEIQSNHQNNEQGQMTLENEFSFKNIQMQQKQEKVDKQSLDQICFKQQKQEPLRAINRITAFHRNPFVVPKINSPFSSKKYFSIQKSVFSPQINLSEKLQSNKIQQKDFPLGFLPFHDYLMKNPVLYDQQYKQLDHSGHRINIMQFLKYDWSQLKSLNLSNTELRDKEFRLLIDSGHYFKSLQYLNIWNNLIVHVSKCNLDQFESLRLLQFTMGRFSNPLDQKTRYYLLALSNKSHTFKIVL